MNVILFMKLLACAAFFALFGRAFAQPASVSKAPEFDVVSIKPSAPDENNRFMSRREPDGIRNEGTPLKMLIMWAYGVKAFQVLNAPDWVGTDRWDLLAKTEGGKLSAAEIPVLLRGTLESRFQLKTHDETKKMAMFALKTDKTVKIKPHEGSERDFRWRSGSLNVKQGTIGALADWLSTQLSRVVVDKTGLQGDYDYKLDWTPDVGEGGPETLGLPPGGALAPHEEKTGPTIFTALKEQLGLRLVSEKGPVKVLVIDNVSKPTEN
jgi:uncharacterized protein (TIGR03435 family)